MWRHESSSSSSSRNLQNGVYNSNSHNNPSYRSGLTNLTQSNVLPDGRTRTRHFNSLYFNNHDVNNDWDGNSSQHVTQSPPRVRRRRLNNNHDDNDVQQQLQTAGHSRVF